MTRRAVHGTPGAGARNPYARARNLSGRRAPAAAIPSGICRWSHPARDMRVGGMRVRPCGRHARATQSRRSPGPDVNPRVPPPANAANRDAAHRSYRIGNIHSSDIAAMRNGR
ncbi:hypothetical protein C7S16_6307 [Burkholderia thailandensis]|uniref:Uncharacterized protein n=1 Tax=Burkholderia thailandensis TaxID=57975 RepID=A0AAW9CVF7_BURTH|nr:hypothetical protein [Burkholderia thailandensis]